MSLRDKCANSEGLHATQISLLLNTHAHNFPRFAGRKARGSQTSALIRVPFGEWGRRGQSPPVPSYPRPRYESPRQGKASAQQSPGAGATHGLDFLCRGGARHSSDYNASVLSGWRGASQLFFFFFFFLFFFSCI